MVNPTVLVTGGAGYIGSHACLALSQAGFTPVVVDNLSTGHVARVQWGMLVQADVTDAEALNIAFAQYKPVAIMHFAGHISVPESVANPLITYRTNTMGSLNILQAMHRHGTKHIIFSSTAAVYGIPESTPIVESAPTIPINPYGHSKLMVERMLADTHAAHGITYAALRYFNAAGATPEHNLGYNRPHPFHLIPMALLAAQGKQPPLKLFGTDYPTPDGTAIRDYIHVADLAKAHVLALKNLLGGGGPLTLNLGTSQGYSVQQVINTCQQVTGYPVPHTIAPRRSGDPSILIADARQAAEVLGWQPRQSALPEIIASDWKWHQSMQTRL